jgi:hypothetical protein
MNSLPVGLIEGLQIPVSASGELDLESHCGRPYST